MAALEGRSGDDTIYGGRGDDTIDAGMGADSVSGDEGNDTYFVDNARDMISEAEGNGNDTVVTSIDYALSDNIEVLRARAGHAGLRLTGDGGQNAIYGTAGNDTLDGGVGRVRLAAGDGNDVYFVGDSGDAVIEVANRGIHLVVATVSHALAANVENLTLSGAANIDGTGNELADGLIGNSGANNLDGGVGADRLRGGGGSDTFIFHAGEGAGDRVLDFSGIWVGGGDHLEFIGYGPNAVLTHVSGAHWRVDYGNGLGSHEHISLTGVTSLDAIDYVFL